jgi:centrosomal protein CEP135
MDFNLRHEYMRKKLDLLGYSAHQLPISAVPLISAILDDLISTTESLKNAKDELSVLLEEKKAWELGNEVI